MTRGFDIANQLQMESHRDNMNATSSFVKELEAIGAVDVLNEMSGLAASKVAAKTWTDPTEASSYLLESGRGNGSPVGSGIWQPQMVLKENASGSRVKRWTVFNTRSDVNFGSYRDKTVAATVCAIMEETGDRSDRRINRINQLCEEESSIIREINNAKRILKETSPANAKKTGHLKNQVDLLTLKLENVRLRLGING